MQAQAGKPLAELFINAGIREGFKGSNHSPVYATLQLPEPLPKGQPAPALELRNRRTATGALSALLLSALQKGLVLFSWLFFLAWFGCMPLHRWPAGAVNEP